VCATSLLPQVESGNTAAAAVAVENSGSALSLSPLIAATHHPLLLLDTDDTATDDVAASVGTASSTGSSSYQSTTAATAAPDWLQQIAPKSHWNSTMFAASTAGTAATATAAGSAIASADTAYQQQLQQHESLPVLGADAGESADFQQDSNPFR
jgi:hypothetical protein